MEAMNEGLNDLEMQSFLPYLLLKCGDSKDLIRNQVRKIVHVLNSISVPSKIFPLILDSLKTKNSRQKAEGLVIADSLIEVCFGSYFNKFVHFHLLTGNGILRGFIFKAQISQGHP
ncbi:unnamed protein product [Meloidogyne enterolobii]|uniref:Uncharacterized protein n=1 Tax=Meloidogyne enterolobii TaxID=390850 RepID=A0ACB1AZH0_MELEN